MDWENKSCCADKNQIYVYLENGSWITTGIRNKYILKMNASHSTKMNNMETENSGKNRLAPDHFAATEMCYMLQPPLHSMDIARNTTVRNILFENKFLLHLKIELFHVSRIHSTQTQTIPNWRQ